MVYTFSSSVSPTRLTAALRRNAPHRRRSCACRAAPQCPLTPHGCPCRSRRPEPLQRIACAPCHTRPTPSRRDTDLRGDPERLGLRLASLPASPRAGAA